MNFHPICRRLPTLLCGLGACALLTAPALAQPLPAPGRADPLDPQASVPVLRYESSLSRYRGTADDKPVGWREANDTVTRIGGWRAYAREAQQPDPATAATPPAGQPATPLPAPASAPPRPAPPAMPQPHAGHAKP
jgi:hypothetical protein